MQSYLKEILLILLIVEQRWLQSTRTLMISSPLI